jgi:hypothetical protein
VDDEMKASYPVLTKETTMWKAWTGFNASHSAGAIYIGAVNLFLAIRYFPVIQDPSFVLLNLVTVLFYLWLAKRYWFSIPFKGLLISAGCFITAAVIIILR